MKPDKIKFLLCILFFIVLAAITYRCAWPADHVFSASDMSIGRLAMKKDNLPASFMGTFSSKPVMGNSGSGFVLFNILLALMPLEIFANTFYGLVLVLGSSSMIWFLRLWGRSWLASVAGALVGFWFNSIMLSAGGHAYKMEVLAFSVLSLCLIEKAVRGASVRQTVGYAFTAGLSVGIMMLEQQDVALLAGLFIGSYALFRLIQLHLKSAERWAALLLPIALVALLLSGRTVLKSYETNIKGVAAVQNNTDDKWNYITQWSLVPSEWPDLIASGWSGWSSQSPEGPYWGKIGQSAGWETTRQGFRNFKLTSIYIGIIPFLLGAYGLFSAIRGRKQKEAMVVVFWGIIGIAGLWLAFGKYSLLYRLFYQLPMVGNIRAPMKFLDNFQICLGIVAAYGLDNLVLQGKGARGAKIAWITGCVLTGLMFLAGLRLLINPEPQLLQFTKMGFEPYADVMLRNMSNAWQHAALLTFIFSGLVFAVWKWSKAAKWAALAFIIVLVTDSLVLTSHYFKAVNISAVKKENALISYLKQHQGDERIFFMDQSGIYNQWLALDGPYHGLNIFNIWQMPRMPIEYKEYLNKVGAHRLRLWELSSIKFITAPAEILQQFQQNPELGKRFKSVLTYQVPTAQGLRPETLLEFRGAIPRLALFSGWKVQPIENHCEMLTSPQYNPQTTVLVLPESGLDQSPSEEHFIPLKGTFTKRSVYVDVQASSPSVLRFSQRYQTGWRVFVDGEEEELLKLDYLCMGVQLPVGHHQVVFRCKSGLGNTLTILAVFIAAVGAAMLFMGRMTQRKQ